MIDRNARATAIIVLQELRSGGLLSSAWETAWPKQTKDFAVRSIGYWIWTLFDDHIEAPIRLGENSDEERILRNSIEFLSSDQEFHPQKSGFIHEARVILAAGVEWKGCELPWHLEWPFPPSMESSGS